MARSHAVWVVLGVGYEPIAGFTVKHELVTWLGRTNLDHTSLEVWRLDDGYSFYAPVTPRRVPIAELLEVKRA